MLKNLLALLPGILLMPLATSAQACTPQGNQTTYGINDTWIGYVYDNISLTGYMGYVNEGSPGNPNFDQGFGGMYANYPTNGCTVYTESFSVRYKLTKTFTAGYYDFTIGGDDGFRFSIDGGVSWLIDNRTYYGFNLNTVTAFLSGTYNLVIEYYDVAHHNRLSFTEAPACSGYESTSDFGSGNVWRGYVYNGLNFDYFKGLRNAGTTSNANFDENFGGSYARFNTSACTLLSEHFTIRYKLNKTFSSNNYSIIVASEDGYRLSLDGGVSWAIDNWSNTSYTSSTLMSNLNGAYDMVLEYKETTGANRISFSAGVAATLPVEFVSFTARNIRPGVLLRWEVGSPDEADHFEVERSGNGQHFQYAGSVDANANISGYTFTDMTAVQGKVFYRIKVVDKSGKVTYSKTIVLTDNTKGISIFPSFVSNDIIYVANDKALRAADVAVTDMSGRVVFRYALNKVAANQTTSVFVPSYLTKGMYILKVEEGGTVLKTEKIFVQ